MSEEDRIPGVFAHSTSEDPFVTPEGSREPIRRFRGRIASGVTIWTAGSGDRAAGLTMSSVLIAEGRPSFVLGLINDTTALFEAIEESQRFVVHVLDSQHKVLADEFAGLRPSPGGLFSRHEWSESEWGPVLSESANRACCSVTDVTPAGYQKLVRGQVEELELGELEHPLVYWRGRYRELRDGD